MIPLLDARVVGQDQLIIDGEQSRFRVKHSDVRQVEATEMVTV